MPNRILKESILSSDTIAALSSDEERFFYRLITVCDDHGRFDARSTILRARLFPLLLDRVQIEDVDLWLESLESVGLVRVYHVAERPYLQMVTWHKHQQIRANKSKWPDPDGGEQLSFDSNSEQVITIDSNGDQIPSLPGTRYPVPGNVNRDSYTDSDESVSAEIAVTKKRPRKKSDHTLMFDALLKEYGLGEGGRPINDRQAGAFGNTAKLLLQSNVVPDDVHILREKIKKAFPNLGTVSVSMLPSYTDLLSSGAADSPPIVTEPQIYTGDQDKGWNLWQNGKFTPYPPHGPTATNEKLSERASSNPALSPPSP